MCKTKIEDRFELDLKKNLLQWSTVNWHQPVPDKPTVSEHQCHTPSKEERRFLYFNHLSKEFLEQMIPHLKALI